MRGRQLRLRCAVSCACALLGLAALATALAWAAIFDSALSSQMLLTPTSRSFKEWRAPEVPLCFEIFLFNWTNAKDFPTEIPNFVQLGPYRFHEHRSHVNLTWHHNNGSLAYRTLRRYFFDPATSNGTLDDSVTTLNALAVSAVHIFRDESWTLAILAGLLAMWKHKISVTKTAGELLFEGYTDLLLDSAKLSPTQRPTPDRFGWFYSRNNSLDSDGYMEVTTGAGSSLPGQILKWNYQDHIPYYSGACSQLSGSAGEFLPRDLTPTSQLTMFMPDLCRTVRMEHTHSGRTNGLDYHSYAISERSFDISTNSTANTCFCNGECMWSGLMNVSACRFDSPAFISLPHFLHGDPRLREMVTGMEPDPDKHEFYFSVEPKLGIPIDVAARFQLNMLLEPTEHVAMFREVPTMMFPILWVQQRVQIDERFSAELRTVRAVAEWGDVACAGAALFFTAVIVLIWCGCKCQQKHKYVPPRDMMFD